MTRRIRLLWFCLAAGLILGVGALSLYANRTTSADAWHLSESRGVVLRGCSFVGLPESARIHAVGVYTGSLPTDIVLDGSSHTTRRVDVVVTEREAPVFLVLSSYEPVVWQVGIVPGGRLLGVLVTGYDTQGLIGIPRGLPHLITSFRRPIPGCPRSGAYAYDSDKSEFASYRDSIAAMTGRDIDVFHGNYYGSYHVIGPDVDLESAEVIHATDLDGFYTEVPHAADVENSVTGSPGLDQLLELGRIRPATQQEIDAWIDGASTPYKRFGASLRLPTQMSTASTYILLDRVDLPDDTDTISFIVPADVPAPGNSRGHWLYFMRDFSCLGSKCDTDERVITVSMSKR